MNDTDYRQLCTGCSILVVLAHVSPVLVKIERCGFHLMEILFYKTKDTTITINLVLLLICISGGILLLKMLCHPTRKNLKQSNLEAFEPSYMTIWANSVIGKMIVQIVLYNLWIMSAPFGWKKMFYWFATAIFCSNYDKIFWKIWRYLSDVRFSP